MGGVSLRRWTRLEPDEDGLGNAYHQWPRMAVFDDQLYAGLANDSTDSYTGAGTKIWRSGDGETRDPVIDDGFGDNTNGGSDALVVFDGFGDSNNASTYGSAIFDHHLFLTTDNEAHDTEIWRYNGGAEHEVYLPLVLRNRQ